VAHDAKAEKHRGLLLFSSSTGYYTLQNYGIMILQNHRYYDSAVYCNRGINMSSTPCVESFHDSCRHFHPLTLILFHGYNGRHTCGLIGGDARIGKNEEILQHYQQEIANAPCRHTSVKRGG